MAKYTTKSHPYYNALSFDGSNDYVNLGDVLDMGTSDMTFIFKVRMSNTVRRTFISKSIAAAGNGRYWLATGYNGEFRFATSWSDTSVINYYGSVLPTDGEWHDYAVSIDRDSFIKMYIDNVLDTTHTINNTSNVQNSNNFVLGCYHPSYTEDGWFYGDMQQVMVFNKALTQEEIELYSLIPPALDEEGLLAYLPLSEGLGDKTYDQSGNSNHGDINGAVWTDKVGFKG